MGCIQLGATFVTEKRIYRWTVLKRKPLDFAKVLQTFDWINLIKFNQIQS